MAEVEMRTLVCPGPPEHEFKHPKGRGRPPRYCSEHKPQTGDKPAEEKKETRKPPGAPASRPKPGASTEKRQAPPGSRKPPRVAPPVNGKADEPVIVDEVATMTESGAIRKLPAPGTSDTKSRAKAESAHNRTLDQQPDDIWPRGILGRPMAKIEFAASELVPTGQYANVSVGPVRITTFIDLDHKGDPEDGIFTKRELQILAQASNELAETVEGNVVAIQRNLVLESMQDQLKQNGNS